MGMLTEHLESLGSLMPETVFTEEEHAKNLEMFVQKNFLHLEALRDSEYFRDRDDKSLLREYGDRLHHANTCYKKKIYGAAESVLIMALGVANQIENYK
jgi:hypothetical protein